MMHLVVRDELCRAPSEQVARRLIEDRVLAMARGYRLPPTTYEMVAGGRHV